MIERFASIAGKVNIGLETDHRGINKFVSPEDQNYQRVLGEIKRLLSSFQPLTQNFELEVDQPPMGMIYYCVVSSGT